MISNRRALAAVAVALLLVTSGCIGFLTGDEPLTFSAEPAAADEATAQEAGYELNGTRTLEVNETFEVAGQERQVVATNYLTDYRKSVELGALGEAEVGVFTVVSTPAVEIAGRTLNPIGSYSNARLVQFVQEQYSGMSDIERVSEQNVTVQGTETTVTKFSATATIEGREVDVFVHVTKYRDGDDFVLALGVYPQQLDGEEENVLALIRSIEHPVSE
ncbi:hypothetical protein SAMN04488133_1566 [Halobellus limi]|uniref:Uncharacterized protein n=1 Tax=Halobellus limi TaxID=699433 RepID=A0A1H5YG46_9EURY|nr:hypothetical protein SAMN04488133_1566 [Halobellus limi]